MAVASDKQRNITIAKTIYQQIKSETELIG